MNKNAFTLIEVMIAVMIVSVVISALITVESNNSHLFMKLQNDEQSKKYLTLILHSDYGLKNKHISLDRTIDRFDVDDDLRRKLRNISVKIKYQKIKTIDLSEKDKNASASGQNLQIGKTIVEFPDATYSYMRVVEK